MRPKVAAALRQRCRRVCADGRVTSPLSGDQSAIVGIAPHSLRAVTPDELAALLPCRGGPIHIHIAEQTREVEECLAWSGPRPVQWLFDHAAVDRNWCLIHATHTTGAEMGCIAQAGAVAGLCPVTEANLGDGIFDAPNYQARRPFRRRHRFQYPDRASEELRQLEYSQRLAQRAKRDGDQISVSTGRALYDRALPGAAVALGVKSTGPGGGFCRHRQSRRSRYRPCRPVRRCRPGQLDFRRWTIACGLRLGRRAKGGTDGRHHGGKPVASRFRRLEGLLQHDCKLKAGTKATPNALYQRIRGDIEAKILSGDWPPGHKVPFEHELMETYDCSRMTVNKVLSALAVAGLVVRRGAGSFVSRPRVQSAILQIPDIKAEVEKRGERYGYRLIALRKRPSSARDRARLGLSTPPGAGSAVPASSRRPTLRIEDRLINLHAVPEALREDFSTHRRTHGWSVSPLDGGRAPHHRRERGQGSRRRIEDR